MTIDILEYQLKYKNDRNVLDLLAAYQEQEEEFSEKLYTEADLSEAEEEGRAIIRSEIEGYVDDLDGILDDLMEGSEAAKTKAIERLLKLQERMRF